MTNDPNRLNPEPGDSDDQAAGGAPQVISSSFASVLLKKQHLLLFSPQVPQILVNFFVDAPVLFTTSNSCYRFFHKCHKCCHLHSYANAYDINFGICTIDIRLSFKGGVDYSKKTLPRYNTWTPRQVTLPWQATH